MTPGMTPPYRIGTTCLVVAAEGRDMVLAREGREAARIPTRICDVFRVPSTRSDAVCDVKFQDGTLAACLKWRYLKPISRPLVVRAAA